MAEEYISHLLDESAISLKIKPPKSSGWGAVSFFTSDYTLKLSIYMFTTHSGITHVIVDICGNYQRALDSCIVNDESWVNLVIEKTSLSIEISCGDGEPLVYDEECARKFGDDSAYISLTSFGLKDGSGSILYFLPYYEGNN